MAEDNGGRAGEAGRTHLGRFAPGGKGGPGRPKRSLVPYGAAGNEGGARGGGMDPASLPAAGPDAERDRARQVWEREAGRLYRRSLALLKQAEGDMRAARQERDALPVDEMKARASLTQAAAAALRSVRENAELLARAAGYMKPDTVNVAVALAESPDWIALRARILAALGHHPEARRDVLAAIAGPGASG